MRNIVFLITFVLIFASCGRKAEDRIPEGFEASVMLPVTPIKDQGKSQFCWVYAMLATIETEHLVKGDSVNLSVDYIARMYLEEMAMERFRSNGKKELSMRGMAPMAIDLLQEYGAMPFDSYRPRNAVNYNVLQRKIEMAVDIALSHRLSEARCLEEVREKLDKEIGYLPRFVFMYGMQYTFLEFAHSVCMRNEYKSLTSLSDYPYGEKIRLPFADNHYDCEAWNIDPELLISSIEESLSQGHPVLWEGGPNDNHAVSIIGMGRDKAGEEYFVAKNSWGEDNPTRGLLYIRKEYVKTHTAVVLTAYPAVSTQVEKIEFVSAKGCLVD